VVQNACVVYRPIVYQQQQLATWRGVVLLVDSDDVQTAASSYPARELPSSDDKSATKILPVYLSIKCLFKRNVNLPRSLHRPLTAL